MSALLPLAALAVSVLIAGCGTVLPCVSIDGEPQRMLVWQQPELADDVRAEALANGLRSVPRPDDVAPYATALKEAEYRTSSALVATFFDETQASLTVQPASGLTEDVQPLLDDVREVVMTLTANATKADAAALGAEERLKQILESNAYQENGFLPWIHLPLTGPFPLSERVAGMAADSRWRLTWDVALLHVEFSDASGGVRVDGFGEARAALRSDDDRFPPRMQLEQAIVAAFSTQGWPAPGLASAVESTSCG